MLCASSSLALLGPPSSAMVTMASSPVSRFVGFGHHTILRYDNDQRLRRGCSWTGIEKKIPFPRKKTASASAYPLFRSQHTKDSSRPKNYKEVTKSARQMFAREISIQSKDSEISIAKVLFYIAAEDEAFLAVNRERDAQSLMKERESVQDQSDPSETDSEELLQLDGKSISEWVSEIDAISKEVEAELVSRDIGCHLVQVLEAVNTVLFDLRGFKRTSITLDPENSYLHSVLNCRCSTAFLISVIYIEVCKRLNVPIVGSPVGEDFLIWPKTEYPEELFKATSGQSLFSIVNGRCVDDPGSMASDLTAKSLQDLDMATNRDIIGIALANLIRLHWRRASKSSHGLMLTSPLSQLNNISSSNFPLLRPQDLRLAIAAAERLLILQPHNWALRRDLGMMLYYDRQYGEAVQELSICMAFAPPEEEAVLEPFVERLHLLRLISSLKPLGSDRLTVP
ncbi:transglutaminase family protein [Arabidopsis thaliana]|uniref:Transglutaminase family protein n=2 Tax=Arabidopsis thaliana TaxID=3702 RepID=F4JSG8_ARATH|nr:transglutaminase family protein [Arabidopsis thaliana]AEE84151.1 transglutaminase family protein [Arabidopsis thaliana]|eukprot:NP_974572.1 transglutaminase family protein [Arabidopsis thaliana]